MKTIEIKEDGKLLSVKWLVPPKDLEKAGEFIFTGGKWYEISIVQPYLYKDHNGNEVIYAQDVWIVKTKPFNGDDSAMWTAIPCVARAKDTDQPHLAIFTTKEAADQFVSENRPFEFTTEDGVTPFKGDHIYCLDKADLSFQGEVEYHSKTQFRTDIYLWFYTEEGANDYIKRHKAVLSLDRIETMINARFEWSDIVVQKIFRSITNLVNEQFKPQ